MSTPPVGPEELLSPSRHDRLGVLTETARVLRGARHVTLQRDAIAALARRWASAPWPEAPAFSALHFADVSGDADRLANCVLVLDALNFCFWGEPGAPRWQVAAEGGVVNGYTALAVALTRAAQHGQPLWDAAYLAHLEAATLADLLRPVPGSPEIPLFEERLANAREVGRVLAARYGGRFANTVEAAGSDAVELALLLARDFPSFADVAEWEGQPVPFLKRAQICAADLHAAFDGQGAGALRHLDELTAFADYKLPQLLRHAGVLVYSPELAARIASYTPLPPGSAEEVEIRAATIWAVELLRRALMEHGIEQRASAIDYRLWNESQSLRAGTDACIAPYHRTRTIYY